MYTPSTQEDYTNPLQETTATRTTAAEAKSVSDILLSPAETFIESDYKGEANDLTTLKGQSGDNSLTTQPMKSTSMTTAKPPLSIPSVALMSSSPSVTTLRPTAPSESQIRPTLKPMPTPAPKKPDSITTETQPRIVHHPLLVATQERILNAEFRPGIMRGFRCSCESLLCATTLLRLSPLTN
jgi:hypothetical protein